jgi:GNAT superfamily N-acetyltransferase
VDPVELSIVDAASAEARWAMQQYFDELARRFEGGFDPGDALAEAAVGYNPPLGRFLLASAGDAIAGCGGVVVLDAGTAEIKRMWIHPDHRGVGLGKRLLAGLEDEARALGASAVVLDTNATLIEAIAMYEAAGYRPTDRYNDNPYAERWFRKPLT